MIGKILAHYKVLEKIGAGGMGEVYRAHDPQLERDVAIKILPDDMADNHEQMARFKLEAKALAAMNHPGIASVFGLHEDDGTRFMAMELVPGTDLAEKISNRPLPVDEALQFGVQLAKALETAHAKGIIHRDLKPQNIMVAPDGQLKVLDFGLARMQGLGTGDEDSDSSLTMELALTQPGTIMGSPAYMSPEQAQGEVVDARADIWAFGAVLYEMLTGNRAFGGKTISETMYLVTAANPDLDLLPASLPTAVRHLIRRCLNGDADRRLQAIGDARIVLQEVVEGTVTDIEPINAPQRRRSNIALWLLLPIAALAAWFLKPEPNLEPLPTVRFEIPFPEGERLAAFYRTGVALSPDGSLLAFVSGVVPSLSSFPDTAQIYLRSLDQRQSRVVPGTSEALQPMFSPDGKWLAFARNRRLEKVPIDGGEPVVLCERSAAWGASWGPNGTIAFSSGFGGVWQVSDSGGEAEMVTELDEEAGERAHRHPHYLPGGEALLYTAVGMTRKSTSTYVQSMKTGERKLVAEDACDARYLASGHVVFAREGRLLAVRFDPDRMKVTGSEVPVLADVGHSLNTGNSTRETLAAQYTVSATGVLAYVTGSVFPETPNSVAWVDRQGKEEPLGIDDKDILSARLSPDGSEVLLVSSYPPSDVWVWDLNREILRRQTFSGKNTFAIWGPAAGEFTVNSDHEGPWQLYRKTIDTGPGTAEKLTVDTGSWLYPGAWSPDGESLAIIIPGSGGMDITMLSGDGTLNPFLATQYSEMYPEFSPDGRWLIYTSRESGKTEIYACPFPGPGRAVQISTQGGSAPAWSRDGRQIFYWSGFDLFSVAVTEAGNRLVPGKPELLFNYLPYSSSVPVRSYDVASDGRFLIVKKSDETSKADAIEGYLPTRIQVVQNWFAELQEMLPTGQ